MNSSVDDDLTRLLRNAADDDCSQRLFRLVEDHLRRIARAQLRDERSGHTLQATVLVDDAFVRLLRDDAAVTWQDRAHFYRAAARAMRNILIDHERRRRAAKRGGGTRRADLEVDRFGSKARSLDLIALDEALTRLAKLHPRQAEVIQLRHFGGYQLEEIARMLDVSLTTVRNDHTAARIWLHREIAGGDHG